VTPFLLGIGSTILGRLLSTQGDHAGAVDALHAAARHAERAGLADPGWDPCPGDLVESLLTLGRVEEAEAELARLVAAGAGLDRPHLETRSHGWRPSCGRPARDRTTTPWR